MHEVEIIFILDISDLATDLATASLLIFNVLSLMEHNDSSYHCCMTVYLPLLLGPGIFSIHDGLLTLIFMVSHFILPITHLYYLSIQLGNNELIYRHKIMLNA